MLNGNGGRKREREEGRGEERRGEERRREEREEREEREQRTCAFSVFGGVEVGEREHLQHLDNKCWYAVISVLFQVKKKLTQELLS